MVNRNATKTISIFTIFDSTLAGLYDMHIAERDLHSAIFNFGREERPEYLDDDNIDRVISLHVLPEWTWWAEARAVQVYQELRTAVLAAEKDGRVAWKQVDDNASWYSLGALLKRQGLEVVRRPETNFNHAWNYGARQIAEAAMEQDLPYRVFGYTKE